MNLLKQAVGLKLLALIEYCQRVDAGISARKLTQLQQAAKAFQGMPKAYSAGKGGTTFYGSVTVVFYLLLLSYICLALAAQAAIGYWGVIAGVVVFILLVVALSGIAKGRTLSLRLFLTIWSVLFVCNVLVAGWLLFVPLSWSSLAVWGGGSFLLWPVRQVMNGPELTKLMQWRVSLKIAQYRRQELTQPQRK